MHLPLLARRGCSLALSTVSAIVLLVPAHVRAQVVRGSVLDRSSRAPVAGVLLSLVDEQQTKLATVLSDAGGSYELRAPRAGRFLLVVQRIGVKPSTSATFSLATQETRRLDVEVDAVVPALSVVRVSGANECKALAQGSNEVVRLWEDARGALTATVISNTRAESASVTRFERDADAQTGRVLHDQRRVSVERRGNVFKSVPAATLARTGFVVKRDDGFIDYFAPDAEVLISDAFVSTHCFRAVRSRENGASLVGLAFAPTTSNRQFDISGVLWLDGRSSELREVVYRYDVLPPGVPGEPEGDSLGGRVRFSRLADGRWFVSEWHIRMPLDGARSLGSVARLTSVRITGGSVGRALASDSGDVALGARVSGVVFDSVSNTLARNATIALDGTGIRGTTNDDGRFSLLEVPPGVYAISISTPWFDSIGVRPSPSMVDVKGATDFSLRLATPSIRTIIGKVCTQSPDPSRDVAVRLTVADAESGKPVSSARGSARWVSYATPNNAITEISHEVEFTLDASGRAMLCNIPANTLIRVSTTEDALESWSDSLRVPPSAIVARALVVNVDRTAARLARQGLALVRLRGRVTDRATGAPIGGVVVRVAESSDSTRTTPRGTFALSAAAGDSLTLVVRRAGFASIARRVSSESATSLEMSMERSAQQLGAVAVTAATAFAPRDEPREFSEHRARGFGRFLSGEELRRQEDRQTSSVLLSMSGVRLVALPDGGMAVAGSSPVTPEQMKQIKSWPAAVRVFQIACYMQVMLNGVVYWTWGTRQPVDIDAIPVKTIAALEVYRSAAETPIEFGSTGNACGTVAVWTRR